MTNPPSVPSLDVEACVRPLTLLARDSAEDAAKADREYAMADKNTQWAALALKNRDRCYAEQALLGALASALPGMGKDSERWRAFTAQHSLAHHYSWDGKPNSQLIILENGFISLDDVADRLRAARAAQPEETSADAK